MLKSAHIHVILLIFLSFIWGSSFILIKKSLIVFNDYEIALLRMSIAWLTLAPFTIKKVFLIKKNIFMPLLVVAILGNAIPAFLFAKAQTELDSSIVGILNSLVPIFTVIIGRFFFKSLTTKNQIFGVIIGLIGAITLLSGDSKLLGINNYSLLVILASIFYAINLNTIKFSLRELSAVEIAGFAFFIIGPISTILLFFSGVQGKLLNNPDAFDALIFIIILAVFGTSFAIIIFNYLIIKTSALFTSSVTYLIPIIALFWGALDGELVSVVQILSLFIIFTGLYLINKKS